MGTSGDQTAGHYPGERLSRLLLVGSISHTTYFFLSFFFFFSMANRSCTEDENGRVGDAIQPTTSSSVIPFSSCLQSFLALGSFQMSQFFTSGGQSIGASASASVLPMNIQDWFPLGWTGWLSCSPRDSQESSPTPQFKSISSSVLSFLYSPTQTSIHDYWKNHSFDYTNLCLKVK